MKPNSIIIICILILLGISVYLNIDNKMNLKASKSLNDSLLVKFKREQQAKLNDIKNDSLKIVDNITTLEKKIVQINWKRKNDKSNYENEIAKLQNITSDSSYYPIIDSIKILCCSGTSR